MGRTAPGPLLFPLVMLFLPYPLPRCCCCNHFLLLFSCADGCLFCRYFWLKLLWPTLGRHLHSVVRSRSERTRRSYLPQPQPPPPSCIRFESSIVIEISAEGPERSFDQSESQWWNIAGTFCTQCFDPPIRPSHFLYVPSSHFGYTHKRASKSLSFGSVADRPSVQDPSGIHPGSLIRR